MSRDAKVGLVIIFSFAVLLGTILVHRFPLTSADGATGFNEPVVSESDPDSSGNDTGSAFSSNDNGPPTSAVDAVAESPTRLSGTSSRDAGIGEAQKILRTPNLTRPPSELPASQSNGALISLTQGESNQQRAAIVESAGPYSRQNRGDNRNSAEANGWPEEKNGRSQPLEIHSSAREGNRNSLPQDRRSMLDTEREAEGSVTSDDTKGGNEVAQGDTTTDESSATEEVETRVPEREARSIANRNFESRGQTDLVETPGELVQPAAGRHGSEREPSKPPTLPPYRGSSRATIDSIPSTSRPNEFEETPPRGSVNRSAPSLNKTGSDPAEDADSRLNASAKSYVVKEGDSFWSISARQYGTGKYFRALEDFNRHRLAAYEDGRIILRPGIEILLPDLTALRSKSATPKQTSSSVASERDGFRRNQGGSISYERDSVDSRDDRDTASDDREAQSGGARTYRVQDGDTLSMIAQRELGTSKRWQEIYELNRRVLDDKVTIKVGMELKLPAARPVEKLVDRPIGGR
jgi:nucleoid-associated protein YgaU